MVNLLEEFLLIRRKCQIITVFTFPLDGLVDAHDSDHDIALSGHLASFTVKGKPSLTVRHRRFPTQLSHSVVEIIPILSLYRIFFARLKCDLRIV